MGKFFYYSFLFFIGFSLCAVLFSLSIIWKFGNDLPDYRYLQSYQTNAMSRVYSASDNIIEEYAEEKRVEFFQKRKTKVDRSQTPKRPILDYIVRKIK